MASITILTLLITSNVISRIQAEEQKERDVQIGNNFSGNPNSTYVYGPILVQENNSYQGNNENIQYGASVTQFGNNYTKHPGKNNIYPGVVVQNHNTYLEYNGNKTLPAIIINQSNNTYSKSIENNKDALKPVIHQSGNFFPSSNDSEARMNTKNYTGGQADFVEQNSTDSQGNSVSTNYDSSPPIQNKTLYNKEKEAHAEKHKYGVSNKQMSLHNGYSTRLYYLIVLLKYILFDS